MLLCYENGRETKQQKKLINFQMMLTSFSTVFPIEAGNLSNKKLVCSCSVCL